MNEVIKDLREYLDNLRYCINYCLNGNHDEFKVNWYCAQKEDLQVWVKLKPSEYELNGNELKLLSKLDNRFEQISISQEK